jgi:late competence protein required for DNA uptake (superfamily II DNA/RNA helicase)
LNNIEYLIDKTQRVKSASSIGKGKGPTRFMRCDFCKKVAHKSNTKRSHNIVYCRFCVQRAKTFFEEECQPAIRLNKTMYSFPDPRVVHKTKADKQKEEDNRLFYENKIAQKLSVYGHRQTQQTVIDIDDLLERSN